MFLLGVANKLCIGFAFSIEKQNIYVCRVHTNQLINELLIKSQSNTYSISMCHSWNSKRFICVTSLDI